MPLRVRHVAIPDIPPRYPPYQIASTIRATLTDHIASFRQFNEEQLKPRGDLTIAQPTVVAFTPRPTFVIPGYPRVHPELKEPLRVSFPPPPEWSPSLWKPTWQKGIEDGPDGPDPLDHGYEPDVIHDGHAQEPAYHGPGHLLLRPVLDLDAMALTGIPLSWYKTILETTTVALLKRGFGINVFTRPDQPGIWLNGNTGGDSQAEQNETEWLRRVASIDATVQDGITSGGVTIHVGQPTFGMSLDKHQNPWERLGATRPQSIVEHMGQFQRDNPTPLRNVEGSEIFQRHIRLKCDYWAPSWDPKQDHLAYTVYGSGAQRRTAPLGMDNFQIGAAWTHEFARQLAAVPDNSMDLDKVVDHAMIVNALHHKAPHWKPTDITTVNSSPPARPNLQSLAYAGLSEVHRGKAWGLTKKTEDRDGPPAETRGPDDRMPSWPLFVAKIEKLVRKSIREQQLGLHHIYTGLRKDKKPRKVEAEPEPALKKGARRTSKVKRHTREEKRKRKGGMGQDGVESQTQMEERMRALWLAGKL